MIKSLKQIAEELNDNGENYETILGEWAFSIIEKCAKIGDEWENSGELGNAINIEVKEQIK